MSWSSYGEFVAFACLLILIARAQPVFEAVTGRRLASWGE
jgi:hypothetical protein